MAKKLLDPIQKENYSKQQQQQKRDMIDENNNDINNT